MSIMVYTLSPDRAWLAYENILTTIALLFCLLGAQGWFCYSGT